MNKKIILIVCRGNITRSPFAEQVINRELKEKGLNSKLVAISRGTQGTRVDPIPVKFLNITFYKNEYRFSKPTLDKFRIDITNHISKSVDRKMAEKANVILAVDESNRVALLQLFPDLKSKIFKLSELTGRDEDFTDPETIRGIEKHFKILSGIKDTIIQGFPKLISLAMKEKKN
jgi:protein-tyrosine-phosphatase